MSNAQGLGEYIIYTYRQAMQDQSAPRIWERKDTYTIRETAFAQAEALYETGKYIKIEIRQKYFDARARRKRNRALKIFGAGSKMQMAPLIILSFAALAGFAAFYAVLGIAGG